MGWPAAQVMDGHFFRYMVMRSGYQEDETKDLLIHPELWRGIKASRKYALIRN